MAAGPRVRCVGCGDVIQSEYRHDYRRCKCGATAIDGGDWYTRIAWSNEVGFPEEVEDD